MESSHLIFMIHLSEKHRLTLVATREMLKKSRRLLTSNYSMFDSILDEHYRQAQLLLIMILHFMKKGCCIINASKLTKIIHHLSIAQDRCTSLCNQNSRELFVVLSVSIDYVYDVLNDFFDLKQDLDK